MVLIVRSAAQRVVLQLAQSLGVSPSPGGRPVALPAVLVLRSIHHVP